MEIKHLKVFVSIAEGHSLTSVAESSGLSKSAMSSVIKNIEKEVGSELFIRSKRSLSLSEYGYMFLATAKKTLSDYESGIDDIRSVGGNVSGDLRIGFSSFFEPFIRKAAAKLIKEYPSLKIDTHIAGASTLNNLLSSGCIDVAFTTSPAYDSENIVSVPCIPIRIMCIMPKTHTLARKDIVTFNDICNHECVMPSEDRRSLAIINKYIDADLSMLKTRININNTDAALNITEECGCITFGNRQLITNRPNLTVRPIAGLETDITSNMLYLRDVHLKKSAIKLKDAIENYAMPLFGMMDV